MSYTARRRPVIAAASLGLLLALTAQTFSQGRGRSIVLATAIVPDVSPLPETADTQEKGGVAISLAPVPFRVDRMPGCSYSFVTGFQLPLVPRGVSPETHQRMRESTFQAMAVTPNDMELLLTVRNRMNRVFRGAGAVVQFNVRGRLQGTDQSRYADFLGMLVPPQGEAQIRIAGPPVSSLFSGNRGETLGELQSYINSGNATIGVFLSDVVTGIDNAGTIVARDNFEWFFKVQMTLLEEEVPAQSRNVWIPNREAVKIMEATPGGGKRLLPRHIPTCLSNAIPGYP